MKSYPSLVDGDASLAVINAHMNAVSIKLDELNEKLNRVCIHSNIFQRSAAKDQVFYKPITTLCTTVYDGLYCVRDSMDEKIIWTVIHWRLPIEYPVDFNRVWNDYKAGFGNFQTEFYIGNNNLHQITKQNVILRIEFYTTEGKFYYADYQKFSVDDEKHNFQLTVSGYSGNATDSLAHHNGASFSTVDRDNDLHSVNCAINHRSGNWFKKYVGLYIISNLVLISNI